jgi:3-oxosteroid 1-dehydrogenase
LVNDMNSLEVDVLVAGSGAGALTAALVAAAAGHSVLIAEKTQYWGGTSATSGGFIWVPASGLGAAAGGQDTEAEAYEYLRAIVGDGVTDANIRAFVTSARHMLAWLEQNSEVHYRSIAYTDYRPEAPGAKLGFRTHDILPFDGRRLGPLLKSLQPSVPATLLFNRIAFTMDDVFPLLHRPPGWQRTLIKVLARYYLDIGQRLVSPRNRFLAAGSALLGRLRCSLERYNVPVWLNSRVRQLERDPSGRVTGAVVDRQGIPQTIVARRAVVVATGGFEGSATLRRKYLPGAWEPSSSGALETNTGDGLQLGEAIGAAFGNMGSAWWGPMIKLPDEPRARLLTFERALPGCMIVNQAGRRYMNEAMAYDVAGKHMIDADRPEARTSPSYFVFDERYRRRYPIGPLVPGVPLALHQAGLRRSLVRAATWSELEGRLGIPNGGLSTTVSQFNRHAEQGRDPEFGRGDSAYDRFYGDPKVHPNPNLGPLATPPFYALPIIPGDIGTNGGLLCNEHAQVLDRNHQPIRGLYATGNTTASVMGHAYPGAGGTLGPSMTFGYVAARHACGLPVDPAGEPMPLERTP